MTEEKRNEDIRKLYLALSNLTDEVGEGMPLRDVVDAAARYMASIIGTCHRESSNHGFEYAVDILFGRIQEVAGRSGVKVSTGVIDLEEYKRMKGTKPENFC